MPGQSISQFLVFHGPLRSNYTAARARCLSLAGDLVDVDSIPLLEYITTRLHEPAFVLAFRGDSLVEKCGAIFPGSAVAIIEDACILSLDFVCEVPIADYFVQNQGDKVGANKTQHLDIHVQPYGFLKYQGHAKDDIVTETVNIMGAIATNPVLPCCKCC